MSLFLNNNLFLNTTVNKVDGKGRISFPASFRAALAARNSAGVVVFQSLKPGWIEGWTVERMHQLSKSLDALSPFSPQRAHLQTAIFGTAHELAIDKEGRCSLPKSLADHAGITEEAAFLGQGETFQIWNPAALQAHTDAARQAVMSDEALSSFLMMPVGTS